MSRLDNIQADIEGMDHDELLAYIRSIRKDRAVSKKVQRTTTKKSRAKKKVGIKEMLAQMTPADRRKFLESLK